MAGKGRSRGVREKTGTRKILAPVRIQPRLPGVDSPLTGDVRNAVEIMMWNFFAHQWCEEDPITELAPYDDGRIRIEVRGTSKGVATVLDAETIIYITSLIGEKLERGEPVSRNFTFSLQDFCRISGLTSSGSLSDRLEAGLERLQGTQIKTNMVVGGKAETEFFSWISSGKCVRWEDRIVDGEKVKGRVKYVRVEISEWLWRALCIDRNFLTYNQEFFKLSPIKRRLYELARVHCAGRPAFLIGLESLRNRVGSSQELKLFKSYLEKMAAGKKGAPLPGYGFQVNPGVPAGKRVPLSSTVILFWDMSAEPGDLSDTIHQDAPLIDATYLSDLSVGDTP
jgi:Replication initiator protein A